MIETIVKVDGIPQLLLIQRLLRVDEQKLRDAINATGYEVKGVKSAPYEKKGFFSFLKK